MLSGCYHVDMNEAALADRGRLHRKANEALDQNLAPDETIQVIITGPSNQAIIGTDRRVFIYKKGFMAGASFGSELTSWDYRNLVGVQMHTGMMNGAVVLQAPGQTGTRTSAWGNSDSDPYKAPNAIPINRPWEPATEGVARLRSLIAVAQPMTASAQASASPPSVDPITQLKQLGELRDAGVLTPAEFESKKAEILGRI